MAKAAYEATDDEDVDDGAEFAQKVNKGGNPAWVKGISGNPQGTHVPKGIVDYIKSRTSNYEDLMDLLLKVAFGRKLPNTQGKPWTYTMQQRLECLNSLLDRSIGKPTQTIVEIGDETAKDVLAKMQASLKERLDTNTGSEAPVEADGNVSPIQVLRDGHG